MGLAKKIIKRKATVNKKIRFDEDDDEDGEGSDAGADER